LLVEHKGPHLVIYVLIYLLTYLFTYRRLVPREDQSCYKNVASSNDYITDSSGIGTYTVFHVYNADKQTSAHSELS